MSIRLPQQIRRRMCGAGLPHPEGDLGWRFCELTGGHEGDHRQAEHTWADGQVVEVTVVEEIVAVPHHVHDFTGESTECVGWQGCTMTWSQYLRLKDAWTKRSVNERWARMGTR